MIIHRDGYVVKTIRWNGEKKGSYGSKSPIKKNWKAVAFLKLCLPKTKSMPTEINALQKYNTPTSEIKLDSTEAIMLRTQHIIAATK